MQIQRGRLEAILEPSVTRWNYGGFLTGPYHVPEEEAIFWSKASLAAPLNDEGARRYRDVAEVAFPEEMAEIWGTDDTGEGGIAVIKGQGEKTSFRCLFLRMEAKMEQSKSGFV